jgi:hypothetical protein
MTEDQPIVAVIDDDRRDSRVSEEQKEACHHIGEAAF